ncbi:hypothetical protein CCR90_18065 [Rhodovulum sulfidophilum]|uniref:hypothetical protein n=1 Tax=Rhodovulum sulfidophilum TaxID=35806 RepID=UPI00191204A5|nr:hypothetical protein [Rhodovulum sulfidophilum]MBK5925631.1 hypothetical protein [Rhodovulum sulfidophilum]
MRNVPNNGWITLGSFASGSFVPAGVNQLTEAQAKDAFSDIYGAVTGAILRAAILPSHDEARHDRHQHRAPRDPGRRPAGRGPPAKEPAMQELTTQIRDWWG